MQIQPYISFNKNHQEAAEFYAVKHISKIP
jgi:uncharacterized glyoxalase superfamily protein PhnB